MELYLAHFVVTQERFYTSLQQIFPKNMVSKSSFENGSKIICSVSASKARTLHNQTQFEYRIYSLIRRTIVYEEICLFDENLLKTRGVSYNRVFSCNDCVNYQTTRPSQTYMRYLKVCQDLWGDLLEWICLALSIALNDLSELKSVTFMLCCCSCETLLLLF